MSYAFTAAAPVTPFPRVKRATTRPTAAPWADRLTIAQDIAITAVVVGLAAAPTAFTIAVFLDAFGLRVI